MTRSFRTIGNQPIIYCTCVYVHNTKIWTERRGTFEAGSPPPPPPTRHFLGKLLTSRISTAGKRTQSCSAATDHSQIAFPCDSQPDIGICNEVRATFLADSLTLRAIMTACCLVFIVSEPLAYNDVCDATCHHFYILLLHFPSRTKCYAGLKT